MLNKIKLTEEITECLRGHDYKCEEIQMAKHIDSWARAKGSLISILSKHPNWNWRQMAVSFDYDTERVFNEGEYRDAFNEMLDIWKTKINEAGGIKIREWEDMASEGSVRTVFWAEALYISLDKGMTSFYESEKYLCGKTYEITSINERTFNFYNYDKNTVSSHRLSVTEYHMFSEIIRILYSCSGKLTEDDIHTLKESGLKCDINQKFSRILNKFFDMLGITDHPEYNKRFAKIADIVNPIKVTRHTLLSVHPCDFLNMSKGGRGTEGWTSCHRLNGSYRAGTLSYMLDKVSMVFYTVSKDYSGEVMWDEPKINRQMFMYQNNMLLQSRLYPDFRDEKNSNNFRNAVRKIFAECLDVPDIWDEDFSVRQIKERISTTRNAKHYRDYEHNYGQVLSLIPNREHTPIKIGATAKCIKCGGRITHTGEMVCSSCYRRHEYE